MPRSHPKGKGEVYHLTSLRPRAWRSGIRQVADKQPFSGRLEQCKPQMGAQMKFVSLNCRGLASTQKNISLKRMMEVLSPEVILPQETMGPELEYETSLTSLLPQYSFTAQSAIGHSRDLTIGWRCIRCTNSGGACLYLNQSHFFQISLGLGTGTNNSAELMTLKLLLCFANEIERNCRH